MEELYYSCSRCGARYSTPVGRCSHCGVNLVPDDATRRYLAAQNAARASAEQRRIQFERKWQFYGKSKNLATVLWILSVFFLIRILLNYLGLAVPYLTYVPIAGAASAMLVPVLIPAITIVVIPLWDFYLGLYKQAAVKLAITLALVLLPIIANAIGGPIPYGGVIFVLRFITMAALLLWNIIDATFLFGAAKFRPRQASQA